jgi:hypothetical protein
LGRTWPKGVSAVEAVGEDREKRCLRKYGGYMGYETGIGLYKVILKEVKEFEGIFRKAAVLLRRLAFRPTIFQDRNDRVAWMATVCGFKFEL